MPPRASVLVEVSPKIKRRNSRRTSTIRVSKPKGDSGVIDFGFMSDPGNASFKFSARKLQQDIKYIQDEVIWDMLIEPMCVGDRPKRRYGVRR